MKNVFGEPLKLCSCKPKTGYFRDGFCRTNYLDQGSHTVCAIMTDRFLKFSKSKGNDLITPKDEYLFPGLKPGDKWCLCCLRWKQAFDEGCAPLVELEATNEKALEYVSLDHLIANAKKS